MAITSGFFESKNGDRKYSAQQFGEIIDGLITDGIVKDFGDKFNVTAGTGLSISVGTGRAWFHNTWTYNSAPEHIDIMAPSLSMSRIDAITLKINKSASTIDGRKNGLEVIRGNYDIEPMRPDVASYNDPANGIWYYTLAYVRVRAGATNITPNDITSMIGSEECPLGDYHCLTADRADYATDSDHSSRASLDDLGRSLMSYVITASINNRVLTLTKGDGSAVNIDVPETIIPNDYVTSITISADNGSIQYNTKAGNTYYAPVWDRLNVNYATSANYANNAGALGGQGIGYFMPVGGGTFTGWVGATNDARPGVLVRNIQVTNRELNAEEHSSYIVMSRK